MFPLTFEALGVLPEPFLECLPRLFGLALLEELDNPPSEGMVKNDAPRNRVVEAGKFEEGSIDCLRVRKLCTGLLEQPGDDFRKVPTFTSPWHGGPSPSGRSQLDT